MAERRVQLRELAESLDIAPRRDRHAPLEPLAGPAHHRHAALPPERRDPPLRRVAQQLLRSARARRHPRRRSGSRASATPSQLPARAARPLRELAVRRGREHAAALGAHRDLHAHVSALRSPRPRTTAGAASSGTCASSTTPARSTSTRRSGGASGRTSPIRPSRSAFATRSPTSPRRSRSPRSLLAGARLARAHDEGEPVPPPHRLIEENIGARSATGSRAS